MRRSLGDIGRPAGRVAGRYTLLEPLGEGGSGAVHRARDDASGRDVAFKQLLSSPGGKRRRMLEALFEREYHTLVRLKHPRIIEVYDFGLTETGPYYTMELLAGDDLQKVSPLPFRQVCSHLRDLASSLALIHAHRLLHRDITPRNVRLTPDGRCKLLDFGALAGFGPARDVVGTPAYCAPEVLRRMPLDPRTDLYALGAVGYFALTGRHAFPTQRFEALHELWKKPPVAPSKLVPEIPPALDSLILSLLSIDPLARPSSPAAVIDRLTAIAGLAAEDNELAAESYLSSGHLVGRTHELSWAQDRCNRALAGTGSAIVLEGPSGIGKTRLLHEVSLSAQLRGSIVLKADAQAAPGTFGVAAALSLQLLASCPDVARREAARHEGWIGHLSPELHAALGSPALCELPPNLSERRARFQLALHEWFLAVAKQRTLLLSTDNLHAADEGSAAFLAALSGEARRARVVVLVTQRSGDEIAAPVAVRALRKRSSRLKLSGFSPESCEAFVKSLFGEVANTGRVARELFEKSAGNPQRCMDLAKLLVQRKIAKYVAGTWVLPLQLSEHELPSRVDELVAGKFAELSASARDLVEALSVHTRPVSIERCLSSSERVRAADALSALDELVAAEILLVEDGQYRFAQPVFGAALLAQLDPQRRRERHLRAAEAMLADDPEDQVLRMEAAWHLLHGGEEARGADLLVSAARAFSRMQFVTESVDQTVRALCAALDVYERQRRPEEELAGLLFTLLPLSYYGSDWRVITSQAMRAFQLGLRVTGLALAQRLRPFLGKRIALLIGQGLARFRAARLRRHGVEFDARAAIVSCAAMSPAAMGTLCTCVDFQAADRLWETLAPLELVEGNAFTSLMRAWGTAQILTVTGRERESIAAYADVRARLRDPQLAVLLGENHRKNMYCGSLFSSSLLECHCSSPRALELASEMEHLGVRIWAVIADQVRRLYHAYRGESVQAQAYHARVEQFATQGSATWQSELYWPAVMLDAEVLAQDMIATRHSWEQLARRARDVPSLRVYADAAQAAYLTLRGELNGAIELYEQLLPGLPPRRSMSWLTTRSYFAQALNLAGQHARAKQVVTDALAELQPQDSVVAMHVAEAERQLALAEAGLGECTEALQRIERLYETYAGLANPLLLGLFHAAQAKIAIRMGDRASLDQHLERTQSFFRPTGNPALIAQWERLAEEAVLAGLRQSRDMSAERHSFEPASIARCVAELDAAADRNECALRLILQRARAEVGYLYLHNPAGLQLVAASVSAPAPDTAEQELRDMVERMLHDEEDGLTVVSMSDPAPRSAALLSVPTANDRAPQNEPSDTVFIRSEPLHDGGAQQIIVLSAQRGSRRVVVGGVILAMGPQDLYRLQYEFLSALADRLCAPLLLTSRVG